MLISSLASDISSINRNGASGRAETAQKPLHIAYPVALAIGALLTGCTAGMPETTPRSSAAPVPTQWHAPLPHGGKLTELSHWWVQFDDPLLTRLIESSQLVSPTLAQAAARIADARAALTASSATLLPTLDLSASTSRGNQGVGMPISTTSALGLQTSWELDIFGANRAGASAAQARVEYRQAGWHDARVTLSSEVATSYVGLRACEAQRAQAELDANSRTETLRLTLLAVSFGVQPPSATDLAQASAAQGNATLTQQRGQCEVFIKSLVALTAIDEMTLRNELAANSARLPVPTALAVATMPAQVLTQRPDIAAAASEVVAASADSYQAQAQRWPRVTLTGSISPTRQSSGGISTNGTVWSVGPIAVTFPLFDAGVRRSNADAARVRYEAARVSYAASLRNAVREVETALINLQSALGRREDLRSAEKGFERSFLATETRYRSGVANLFDLEDSRRSLVTARSALIEQQRESVSAWISLYRAIGGGWDPSQARAVLPSPP